MQLDTLRCCALDWAYGLSETKELRPELGQMLAQHKKFTKKVMAAFATLIVADAERTPHSAARALYQEYLNALAPLVPLVPQDKLALAVKPALATLAARSGDLAKEVNAYRASTANLLQWRRRTAEAYARARTQAYRPLELCYADAVRSRSAWKGLLPVTGAGPQATELLGPAATVMRSASKELLGVNVLLVDLVGSVPSPAVANSRYRFRTIAYTYPVESDRVASEIAALRKELWAEGGSAPLTLEAAVALATAERGDFAAVGGAIAEFYLEPLIVRLAALTDNVWTYVALGPLPSEPEEIDLVRHVLMRFRVEPAWVQHPCFFVELTPSTQRDGASSQETN